MIDTYIPEWANDVKEKYKSAVSNAFILTGNIGDYSCQNSSLYKYLIDFLKEGNMEDVSERKRTNKIIRPASETMRMDHIYFYDVEAKGHQVYPQPKDSRDGTNIGWSEFIQKIKDIRYIEDLSTGETRSERNAFIFIYPQFLIPSDEKIYGDEQANVVSLHRELNSPKFINSANIVFIITESLQDIHSMFTGSNCKTTVVDIPLPDEKGRQQFINWYLEKMKSDTAFGNDYARAIDRWPIGVPELVNLTSGLQLTAIEDVLLTALLKERKKLNGNLPEDYECMSHDLVMNRKKEVIQKQYGDVIEIFDTVGYSLNSFAGQDRLKKYFREVIIRSFHDTAISDIAPKGIIMMGPPGTGKTFFARCAAGDAGINFLEFKMSKILGKYVGESEKSMEKALSVFRALAPVGVFIDEVDQVFPSRSDGASESSVNANLFGMILAEMSKPENRGHILWLAATNYPNKVDEALKRPGRFDKKIPFFAPSEEERKAVFELHLNKMNIPITNRNIFNEVVKCTDGYTQAEIEGIVVKTLELVKRSTTEIDPMIALHEAKEFMMSSQNANIKYMEDIALMECNDAEFIPESKRNHHKKLMGPPITEGTTVVDRSGTVSER